MDACGSACLEPCMERNCIMDFSKKETNGLVCNLANSEYNGNLRNPVYIPVFQDKAARSKANKEKKEKKIVYFCFYTNVANKVIRYHKTRLILLSNLISLCFLVLTPIAIPI